MATPVTWKRSTNFTGRNGYSKCSGLDMLPLDHNDSVMLSPLTSRGAVGRCNIEIPMESLPEVIAKLQSFVIQLGTT